jgi:uroporphyrinogen decarboxylase
VLATIELEETDRIPVVPHQCGWSSKLIGRTWAEHANDAEVHAAAQLAVLEQTGVDGIVVNIGSPVEAHAVGCPVVEEDHNPVRISGEIIHGLEDIGRLGLPKPEADPYMRTMLGALRILKDEVGDDVAIWAGVNAPFQVGGLLRGLKAWMRDTIKNPDLIDTTLEFTTSLVEMWARELVRAGADVLFMGDSLASRDVISVSDYMKWAAGTERVVMDAAKDEGAKAMLHICGRTDDRWVEMLGSNADIFDLDSPVDLAAAKAAIGDQVAIRGNVDTTLLAMRTADDVLAATIELIERVGPGGWILGSGCEIGHLTPVENIVAMVQASRTHGQFAATAG